MVKMRTMNRRGVVEIPFHWIFVMVAGFIILAFFFTVALRVRSASEAKLEAQLSASMDTIFSLALQSPGTLQNLSLPRKGMKLECTAPPGCDCKFLIGRRGTGFREKILFGHSELNPPKGFFWTIAWKYPFHMANFLYTTTDEVRYYLVYDPDDTTISVPTLEVLKKTLITELNVEILEVNRVGQQPWAGHKHTRFVFLGVSGDRLLHESFKKRDVDVVELRPEGVRFWQKDPRTKELVAKPTFISIPSRDLPVVLAAIFAADENMFRCQMGKAFANVQHVSTISSKAVENIGPTIREKQVHCGYFETNGVTLLNNLRLSVERVSFEYLTRDSDVPSVIAADKARNAILEHNARLVKDGCPSLY